MIVLTTNTFSTFLSINIVLILFKNDNEKSVNLSHNSVFHGHIKYINISYHYIQNKVVYRKIDL